MATRASSSDPVHDLFLRAQRGDRQALDGLLERFLPSLRAFARLQMGEWLRSRESESDLVQTACFEVLGGLDDLEYRGEEALRAWLFGVVRNKLQDKAKFHRAQRRDVRREFHPALSDEQEAALLGCYRSFCTPSQDLAAQEQIAQVEAAFARLPEHYREVITLSRIGGLSQEELAERMRRTVPSVRNLLHRALARLSTALDG